MRNEKGGMRNENSLSSIPNSYINREVEFQYRKRTYTFSLSLDLFSSAGIDTGSRFLLKIFSDFLDKHNAEHGAAKLFGGELPYTILDAGSGVGVLGICAAGALSALVPSETPGSQGVIHVRSQDRDELARLFTAHNAERNGIKNIEAHAEPLLAGPAGWDLILTNIPAKAGLPVLEDFVCRSAGLLKKNGLVFLVAVNTLADFFRSRIATAGALLLIEETGKEHTVFVYGRGENSGTMTGSPVIFDEKFPQSYPFYLRNRDKYEMEGVSYSLDTVHGAANFDSPGGAAETAAKLAVKIDLKTKLAATEIPEKTRHSLLIHDAGQGHFGLWLAQYLEAGEYHWVLSGRNVLALAAARAALTTTRATMTTIIPAVGLGLEQLNIREANRYDFISFFPATSTEANLAESVWQATEELMASGGILIAGMSSMEAERFGRKKTQSFVRLADIKRAGFRALAWQKR